MFRFSYLWQSFLARAGRGKRHIPRRSARRTPLLFESLEGRWAPSVTPMFLVDNNWGSGLQASMSLTNSQGSAPIANWQLEFDYAPNINNIWNAKIVSHVGNHYVISGAAWNSTLSSGSPVSFGFIATPGSNAVPANYLLNGSPLGGPSPALPTLSIGNISVNEPASGSANATFTVSLSAASSNSVTVGYATVNGTAQAGSDFTAASGTLTFAAGQTSKTISVPILSGSDVGNETFSVVLSSPSGATIAQGTGVATIVDYVPPVLPTLSIGNSSVNEPASGSANATFTVSLSAASSNPVTVAYATANGTAQAGSDFTAASGTLTFTAGQTSKTISIAVLSGSDVGDETFSVVLSSPSGATIAQGTGVGTIVDYVPPPPPPPSSSNIEFKVTTDWGSGYNGDITIRNSTNQTITNWTLQFDYSGQISSIWNASIASHVGGKYVIQAASWNSSIAPGASVTFGFTASPGNNPTGPTNYVLQSGTLANIAPVAGNASVSTVAGSPLNVKVLNYASDANGDTLTVSAVGSAQHGTAAKNADGSVTYTPASGYIGSDAFTYTVSDGRDGSATGTISVAVNANRVPTAGSGNAATLIGQPITISVLNFASDPDGDALTLSSVGLAQHGTVLKNANGTATYTPATGYSGSDSFSYTVSDGHGGAATGSIAITVSESVSSSTWPAHFFSPYVDTTNWPIYNFLADAQTQGLRFFNLGFVVAGPQKEPAWGGYQAYDVVGTEFSTNMANNINALRQLGGDVMVSFGGAANQELALVHTSVASLQAAYQTVIDTYDLNHIDFDIEGHAAADKASVDRRSQAIANLQQVATAAGKSLTVWFTLPVLPSGLTHDGVYILQSALAHGVNIGGVNIMAMDYGDSAAPNPQGQMGTYAIQAATSLFNQLQSLYGSQKTEAQLWNMIGVTPMIGLNDVTTEVFDQAAAQQLLAFAQQKGIGQLSMWSINRDQNSTVLGYVANNSSSINQEAYDFSLIFNQITG